MQKIIHKSLYLIRLTEICRRESPTSFPWYSDQQVANVSNAGH